MGLLTVLVDFPGLVEDVEKVIPGRGLEIMQAMDVVCTMTFGVGLVAGAFFGIFSWLFLSWFLVRRSHIE